MTKYLSLIVLLTLSTACLKTADQVQREKRFENMSEQMKDSQGLMANAVSQMKDMQVQLDRMNGRLEELEYNQKKMRPDQIAKMNEDLALIKSQQEAQNSQLIQIQNELREQRAFMEKVTQGLSSLNKSQSAPVKKKDARAELAAALELVKENKYSEARNELEPMINNSALTAGDINKVMFGLGRVEFYTKNYDKALVYFSKIFSKYPKSSLAPSSLLFIGKTLSKMGKTDEAKEAFAKVMEDYPSSKEAKEAKKEI